MNETTRPDELLERMETLLREWRPAVEPGEAQLEIPLLTEALQDEGADGEEERPPIPAGVSPELLQAHLAVAAEQVMRDLYRDLTAELNDTVARRMNETIAQAVDEAIARTVKGLRRQVLVSVAESLTHSIEDVGHAEHMRPEPAYARPKSRS